MTNVKHGMERWSECLAATLVILGLLASGPVCAQTVKMGILTDLTGPYSDQSGKGGVIAAQMAIEDAKREMPSLDVQLLVADHQNKGDIGSTIARQWLDQDRVDAIVGLQNSTVSLAVQQLGRDRGKILITGGATSDLTGPACAPYSAQWTDDTYVMATAPARLIMQLGGDKWFFITVDYTFGQLLQRSASQVVEQGGGKVVGAVRHPLNNADFSSYLLAAQSSGANVIAFASAGGDAINAIKQAHEFGLGGSKQRLVPMAVLISDVHALGLEVAQGLTFTTGFYWDRTPETRAWSRKFFDRVQRMPTREQAENYSSVLHYLRAVYATQSTDAAKVMAKMKEMPVNDFYAPGGTLREDGRLIHDMYLARVKSPAESKYPWDYYEILAVLPGASAFRPLHEGGCPFIQR